MPVPLPNLEGTPSSLLLSPTTHKSWSRICGKCRKFIVLLLKVSHHHNNHHQQQRSLIHDVRFCLRKAETVMWPHLFFLFYFCTWLASDSEWLKALGKSHTPRCLRDIWPLYDKEQHVSTPACPRRTEAQLRKANQPLGLRRAWFF